MRNSTFTPRNRFAQKAMSITTKVMIFGVLLSLFLFACVGTDTLEEIALAGESNSALSGYGDQDGGLTEVGTVKTKGVSSNFSTFKSGKNVLISGDSNPGGNSDVTNGWTGPTAWQDYAYGWYVTFTDSMYYAIDNSNSSWSVSITEGINLEEHASENEIKATYYKTKNGTSFGATDHISSNSVGGPDYLRVTQAVSKSNMTNNGSGAYLFYTRLNFTAQDGYTVLGNKVGGKSVKAEVVNDGIYIDMSANDIYAATLDRNGLANNIIRVRDSGAGIRSVKVIGPDGTTQTFYAPSSNNAGKNVNGGTNPAPNDKLLAFTDSGVGSGFDDNTRYFSFVARQSGLYKMVITDHLNNSTDNPNTSVEEGETYTVPEAKVILRDNVNLDANDEPTKYVLDSTIKYLYDGDALDNFSISDFTYNGGSVVDKVVNALYGMSCVGGLKATSNVHFAEFDSNGNGQSTTTSITTLFRPKEMLDVVIDITWQGYEFGKDENNTGVWGSEGNPYLIQTDQHIKNLARIVNGELSPLNSVVGKGLNPTSSQAQATAITYAGAHFRLDNSLSSTTPIGKDGKPFAGDFDGNGKTITFSLADSNTSYVGVFGYIGTGGNVYDLTVSTGNANVAGKNYVGIVAGYNAGTINNCSTTGSRMYVPGISQQSEYVGGIVGYNAGTVSGCASVIAAAAGNKYVGGIAGGNSGTITNCTTKINNWLTAISEATGGIVGKNEGTVRYCVNFGEVSIEAGGVKLGGIIGDNVSGAVEYVYNFGSVVSAGGAFGGVVGASSSAIKGYAFVTSISNNSNDCTGTANTGYYVSASQSVIDSVKPMIGTSEHTLLTWEDIRTNNFDGFTFVGLEAPYGQYLSLQMGSDGFAQPTNTPIYIDNNSKLTFDFVSYSNAFNPQGNIEVVLRALHLKNKDGEVELDHDYYNSGDGVLHMVYDGRNKLDLIESDITIDGTYDRGYSAGMETYVGSNKITSYVYPSIVSNSGQATVYSIATNSATNDVVWGKYALKIKIVAFDLNADYAQYYYDGTIYGNTNTIEYDSKTLRNITNESAIGVTSENTIYIFRKLSNGRLIYVEDIEYKNASSEGIIFTDDYEDVAYAVESGLVVSIIEFTHSAPVRNEHSLYDSQTTLNGELCWTGVRTLNYLIVDSDFGKHVGATGAWGSSTNPYVISHWVHLVRLSEIVNKVNDPIDSVAGMGKNPTNVKANNIFFTGGCYFEVQGTIELPDGMVFKPIGGSVVSGVVGAYNNTHSYFGGNIYGANGDAAAEINLGNSLSEYNEDYSGLFGIVMGTESQPATITNLHVSANTISGNRYVGSLVGRAEQYVTIDNSNSTNTYNINIDVTGTEYVGGLVGYAGLGTEIYGRYVNNKTVTASGDYIGGFIGQIIAGAGKQDKTLINPTFYFGNSDDKILGFENNGIVSLIDGNTASYVGGIIGGAITNTGTYKDYLTILTPEYMRNMAPVAGTQYVGGFIGELSDNVALKLSNYNEYNSNGTAKAEDNWSYNGKKDSDVDGGISGTANYVGGLVGKMGDESHQIIGVFNTMKVHSQGGNFVGGLVGEMVNGTIDYCFVTIPGTTMITADINLVHSTNPVNKEMGTSVGGLVGNASGGSIRNSYVQGFSFDVVDSSRGGVAGTANTNVSIQNAWALYITNIKDQTIREESDGTKTVVDEGVTYNTTAKNINGRYILTYGGRTGDGVNTHAHATATISEMLVFAGLKTSADLDENNAKASNNEVLAMKGMISLGLNLPAANNAGDAKERIQLTFYDASGYENPFLNPFDDAANDEAMSNLYIRLNANADSSLIIAATAVHFGTVENYDGKEAWEDAYSNIGDDALYQLVMYNGYEYKKNDDGSYVLDSNGNYVLDTEKGTSVTNNENMYAPNFQVKYGYDYYSDDESDEINYVFTSVKITRSYGQKSEVAPLIIASKADWIAFAKDVRDEKYYNKTDVYVKLATDLIGGDRVTASDLAGSVTHLPGTPNDTEYMGNFMGTFDGDGHTIELDVQYNKSAGTHAELGLFRGASGATFKNLTLTGTIKADSSNSGTTGTNNIGAFVGRAHGNLTFENCTNDVDITARGFSVGGFVGATKLTVSTTNKYTFIGCVNSGNITTYSPVGEITYNTYDTEGLFENPSLRSSEFYGVGGFIGTVWNGTVNVTYSDVIANDNIAKNTGKTAPTENENGGEPSYSISGKFATTPVVVMESCRNTGNILGSYNVGGLIGFNGGSTEIMNCGNTGTVEAIGEGTPTAKLNRRSRSYIIVDVEVWEETILGQTISREYNYKRVYVRRYLNAGGLVGLSSSAGHVDMYTSYNAGTIHAWGNNAGGLIAADTEYTKVRSSNPTNIFYCYNTGEVITGADMYTVFYGANKEEAERYDQYVDLNDVDEMKEKGRFLIKRTGSNNNTVLVDNMPNDKQQQSVDHYEMSLRHEDKLQYENSTREGGAFGVQVGGIIGATTNTDIKYCYNVGTITCRGLATYTHRGSGVGGWTTYTEYHSRAGGIVGYVDGGLVSVQNSYSVGDIRIEARHAVTSAYGLENWIQQLKAFQQQRPMYVAGIVGHHNSVGDLSSKVTNCYSLMWQCHYLSEENKWERYHIEGYNPVGNLVEDWRTNKLKFVMGNLLPVVDEHSSSGYVVRDISYLTAITNENGIATMPAGESYNAADPENLNIADTSTESKLKEKSYTIPSAINLNHANAGGQSDVRTLRGSYDMIKKAGTSEGYGGWIFMPGCLPQLAMFALDTQDGLAMTSYGYGRNNQGEYVKQVAGSEFNPYVIKDGVDLLGLSALVTGGGFDAYIDFDNKYIEFANGVNNLSGAVSTTIQMPQNAGNFSPSYGDGRVADYVFSGTGKGKSYHLYDRAANGLHNGNKTTSNTNSIDSSAKVKHATAFKATKQNSDSSFAYGETTYYLWLDKHHIYDGGSNSYKTGDSLGNIGNNVHNFNPIGYRGTIENGASKQAFKGNISGAYYVEITNATNRQSALDNGTGYVYIKDKYVLYNKNSRDHKKYIEDGGKVYDVRQTEILDLEVRGGYITAVGSGNSAIKDSYAGLFGLVEDANISYITVTGTATAYGEDGSTAQAGIVAKAYGETTLANLKAGVTSGAIENRFVVRTASGTSGYVGGIVGYADSGATGNRLTISDCVITDAEISTHKIPFATALDIFKIGAGGIVGYTQGDNITSYTDITDCHVVKAYIHSHNGFAVAGIVGNQGLNGALAVEDCAVGTKGAGTSTTNVTIEGMAAIGGIISYAFATASCSNSYIDCYVYEDVLIRRTDRHIDDKTKEETDSTTIAQYGAAIGGIIGAVTDQDGKATFNGQIEFYGTINLGDNTNSKNVGGAVGYMGTSAKINADCDITIGGKIQATGAGEGNPQGSGENIGGFAGVSNGAILDGAFYIYPVMTTPNFDNVGGFIGNNQGKTEIARTATIYTYLDKNGDGDFDTSERGSIVANRNVGGLIGINSEGTEIIIGIAQSGAESFGAGIANIELGAEIDGKGNIGGFVGGNYGKITTQECSIVNFGNVGGNSTGSASSFIQCVGGVVGYVGPNGNVIIEKHDGASIINMGVVGNTNYWTAYQEYVGGVIGASYGAINIKGDIMNQGHIYGYRYVGGVIGVVGSGTISGELNNGTAETSQAFSSSYGESEAESAVEEREGVAGATVTAVQSVGGVIGVVMENATIDGASMNNYGTVTADSHDIAAINNVSNLGGVIGLHYGVINNSSFNNYGTITAENFAGGAIGVSAGTISGTDDNTQTKFVNHATLVFTGNTALGGAVGYITASYDAYYPGGKTTGNNPSTVSYTYFSYEPVDSKGDQSADKVTVQATGVKGYTGNIDLNGGVGGVFGVIDSTEIALVETLDGKGNSVYKSNWIGNSFFIHGDVIGGTKDANGNITVSENVDSVGGVVGIIKNAYVNIRDMLVYHSIVAGNQYVGGIVGWNQSAVTLDGEDASIYNCYNVYGEVKANGTNEAGGIVGHVPETSGAKTFASYWVKSYSNEHLQKSNPDNIAETLDKADSWQTFVSASEYANNVDIGDKGLDIYAFSDAEIATLIDEAVKAGKFNDANGNKPTTTPTRQDYYDMLTKEAIQAGTIAAGSDSDVYRKHILDNNGCLGTADGKYETWKQYFEANDTISVNGTTYNLERNGNGDWGYYTATSVAYNTGRADGSTGYYYIFANDASDFTGGKSITVDHTATSGKLDMPYTDEALNFWLIIANSPNKAYNSYASTNVFANGNVVPGVIYATAYRATTNGYYLYINSSNAKATTLNASGDKAYIATVANSMSYVAGNVMIFYKEYQAITELEYNGFYRHAPANEDLTYMEEQSSINGSTPGANYFDGINYYSFFDVTEPVEDSTVNFGKNAGTYDIKANIWTYDSLGNTFNLGSVNSVDASSEDKAKYQWTIVPRELTVKYSTTNHRQVDDIKDAEVLKQYTGKFSHCITVTVSGIALDEAKTIANFSSGEEVKQLYDLAWPVYNGRNVLDLAYNEDTGFAATAGNNTAPNIFIPEGVGVDVVAYCREAGVTNSPFDTTNTIGSNEALAKAKYYTITYYVFAKNAGTYNITVGTDNNHKAPSTSGNIIIEKRKISLSFTTSDSKALQKEYTFDGGAEYRGVQSITFTNIASSDLTAGLGAIISADMTHGALPEKNKIATNQTEYVKIEGTTIKFLSSDIGKYVATIALDDDFKSNYELVSTNAPTSSSWTKESGVNTGWKAEWSINPYAIQVQDIKVTGKTVIYNGHVHTVEYTTENNGSLNEDGAYEIVEKVGPQTVKIIVQVVPTTGEGTATKAVNVGDYKIDIVNIDKDGFTYSVTGTSLAQAKDLMDNYETTGGAVTTNGDVYLRIKPREIRFVWGNADDEFTYDGQIHGFDEESIKLQVNMNDTWDTHNTNPNWENVGTVEINGNTLIVKGVTGSEELRFVIENFTGINASEYTANVTKYTGAYGKNYADIETINENYNVTLPDGKTFDIKPKDITLAWSPNANEKTFEYNGQLQGYDADDLLCSTGGLTISNDGKTLTINGVNGEKISFTISNFKNIDANVNGEKYTAHIETPGQVSGTNADPDGVTIKNYNFVGGIPANRNYTITPMSITLAWTSNVAKSFVYNGQYQGYSANDLTCSTGGLTISNDGKTLTINGVNGETLHFTASNFTNKNADKYTASISDLVSVSGGRGKTTNYSVSGVPTTKPYEIVAKQVEITWKDDVAKSFLYNGQKQGLDENSLIYEIVNGDNAGGKVTATIGNDTLTLTGVVSGESLSLTISNFQAVNAGTYTASVSFAGNNSNYKITWPQEGVQYTINAREVKLSWTNLPTGNFVYKGTEQGLGAGNVTLLINNSIDGDDWQEVGNVVINGNTLTISNVIGAEQLDFAIESFTGTNAGSYTAKIVNEIKSVAGNNATGNTTLITNYSLVEVPADHTFKIEKSKITITPTSTKINGKVFDGNSQVPTPWPSFTVSSTNNGATNTAVITQADAHYTNNDGKRQHDVGDGYYVRLYYALSDDINYEVTNSSLKNDKGETRYYVQVDANASITPKGLTVILNTNNQTTATKVFDNSNIYAEAISGTDGTAKSSGVQFKTGRGITVTGFVTNYDGIKVTAVYQEVDRDKRSQFDAYVNDIYKNADGSYSKGNGIYYKQLHISLSGDDSQNFFIKEVKTKSGDKILEQSGKPSGGNYAIVADGRALDKDTGFRVTITPYSVKADYYETTQSYANADNTYNTTWKLVTGSLDKSSGVLSGTDLTIKVTNGWMGPEGNRTVYKKYTRIVGSSNSNRLGAYLESKEGYDLCVTLRNQPTLIIGYFVHKESGVYEIGTMAGLLIATEYYKGNFAPDGGKGYEYELTEIDLADLSIGNKTYSSWNELFADEDFDITKTKIYLAIEEEKKNTTDADLKAALQTQLDSFEYSAERDKWVYWKAKEVTDNKYEKFKLINNIDGILTASDMEILKGAFGTDFGIKWGVGTSSLGHVVFAEEGSVVIFNDSVFNVIFSGQFSGNGYTIDHLTITSTITSAGDHNIGMFSAIQTDTTRQDKMLAFVTDINFRNLSIYVIDASNSASTTINVGAVAGEYAGTSVMKNITVHGTISVKSTKGAVHVGGVIGYDETGYVDSGVSSVLERAIIVATLRGEGATAIVGGAIGVMSTPATSIAGIVSLSEVYAEGASTYANGYVGMYCVTENTLVDGINFTPATSIVEKDANNNDATITLSNAFMDAVYEISATGEYTKIGGGKTYDELYNGSKTAFDSATGNYGEATKLEYGTYDVVKEKDAISEANNTGSMRLVDMVDIYVLGYGLTDVTIDKLNTFHKESTSKYFHASDSKANDSNYTPNGTDGNRIKIAYQQHLSLLRMFNYMNFEVTRDIKMYTGYKLAVVNEAFIGSVTSNSHIVNVRSAEQSSSKKATLYAYQPLAFDWLVID